MSEGTKPQVLRSRLRPPQRRPQAQPADRPTSPRAPHHPPHRRPGETKVNNPPSTSGGGFDRPSKILFLIFHYPIGSLGIGRPVPLPCAFAMAKRCIRWLVSHGPSSTSAASLPPLLDTNTIGKQCLGGLERPGVHTGFIVSPSLFAPLALHQTMMKAPESLPKLTLVFASRTNLAS